MPVAPAVSTKPLPRRTYRFFADVEVSDEGVTTVRFDGPKRMNTISFAMKDEMESLWRNEIHDNASILSVVFLSSKPDNFIAGADIGDISSLEDKSQLTEIIGSALGLFRLMRSKGVPLVSGIHGPALGGGLEWALWCDYRVCSDWSGTKMGLPEVKLGLLPGFGGTQNLTEIVGAQAALDMMLTGKDIRPDKAKKMGLVDLVVGPASLEAVATQSAADLASGKLVAKRKKKNLMNRIIEDTSFGRSKMWTEVKKKVDKNAAGKYPAPYAIVDCVRHGLENPQGDSRFENEREQFAKLAATDESAALIGIFEGMTSLKKHGFGEPARPVKNVAVIGAGLMGAGIAQVSAEKGFRVVLKDRDDESVGKGTEYAASNWRKKVQRRRMTQYKYNTNISNIIPVTDKTASAPRHLSSVDLVIEAVPEDLALKHRIVQEIEAATPDHCVLATNTSAIPIADIAEASLRPENLIGMHYFSPVPSMPLLEVIPHEGTCDGAKAAACEVGTKQGKTVIVVKDVPGFYVNRCLGPYLVEVTALARDGASLELMDSSMKNFGMPVGPITLADEVGLDVTSHVASFLSEADLGVRMSGGDVSFLSGMIAKGWLGRKSGKGFYVYEGKKKTISTEAKAYAETFVARDLGLKEEDVNNRIIGRFVNEAAKCLEDGIIADPVAGDIGLVFGTGFPPFLGGPFRYLDSYGVDKFVGMMDDLADEHGPQFEPCQLLRDHARSRKKFH